MYTHIRTRICRYVHCTNTQTHIHIYIHTYIYGSVHEGQPPAKFLIFPDGDELIVSMCVYTSRIHFLPMLYHGIYEILFSICLHAFVHMKKLMFIYGIYDKISSICLHAFLHMHVYACIRTCICISTEMKRTWELYTHIQMHMCIYPKP